MRQSTERQTGAEMDRRAFLRRSAASTGVLVATTLVAGVPAGAQPATPGAGPYGPLLDPDENGLMLPAGFRSRVIANALVPVGLSGYVWHGAPDGGACFATPDGGWIYTSNSEVPDGLGGCGAVRFSATGEVADAYSILTGTSTNCAGGATPWGTWLSCEEHAAGLVWECDPQGEREAISHPAMGSFSHEAVAVDPVGRQLYMTEDVSDGRFYRYSPLRYPDLSEGRLEVLVASADTGQVTWAPVPDPSGMETPTRLQVPESKAFDGGEGIWYDAGFLYFTTKGDNRVWVYDIAAGALGVLYDAAALESPPLTGVDNVVVAASGDVIVAEDGGDMDLVLITPDRVVSRLVKVTGQDESELCGPAFDPSGGRLYFSSQRGPSPIGPGVTYEVSGPFRTQRPATGVTPPAPLAPPAREGAGRESASGGRATESGELAATGLTNIAGLAGLGLIASALGLRRARSHSRPTGPSDGGPRMREDDRDDAADPQGLS